MSAAVGFVIGAWTTACFGAVLLVGGAVRNRWRGNVRYQTHQDNSRYLVPVRSVPLIEEEAMEQLSLIGAMEAKDEILAEVAENHEGWMTLAVEKFHATRHLLPDDFLGEDIRRVLTEAGLPKAVTPHQWGALIGFLAKRKHIVHTGAWRPMKAAGSNGRKSPAYALAVQRELEPA